ncbi:MAG: hypothetical protein FJX74_23955 [Armatimonadetes bacterium]|nr:hypothetical protein [Armatimonadota bacterium]
MKRAVSAVVVLLVVAGMGVRTAGCSRDEAKPPVAGPIGPTGPGGPGGAGGPMMPLAFTYVCPDHADQTSATPAKCPTCDKPMKADTTMPVEYSCPMHPEVVQSEPGECSKCEGGMLLPARPAGGAAPPDEHQAAEPVTPPDEDKAGEPAEPEKGEADTT